MKITALIFIILSALFIGCSSASGIFRDAQIENDIKPFMEKTPQGQRIEIAVPVYRF